MDEGLRDYLVAMEARLMGRINGSHESLLTAIRELRGDLRDLRGEHDATRTLVTALPATVLKAIEQPLTRRIRAIEDRLDKLEGGE
jgi:hypothetical protein